MTALHKKKKFTGLVRVSTADGQKNEAARERTDILLVFGQAAIIPPKFFQTQFVRVQDLTHALCSGAAMGNDCRGRRSDVHTRLGTDITNHKHRGHLQTQTQSGYNGNMEVM